MSGTRRLAAILAADVVGYSRLWPGKRRGDGEVCACVGSGGSQLAAFSLTAVSSAGKG